MTAPNWWKRPILRPANDFERDAVVHVQRILRVPETAEMDDSTVSAIRGLQMLFGLRPNGIIDQDTAEQIERIRNQYAV